MEPGQYAVQLGAWIGAPRGGITAQLGLRAEVPFSHRLGASVLGGIQRELDGSIVPRDTIVAATWVPVSTDELSVRLQPGISLPTGGLNRDLLFTPMSTSSFDPWIGADVYYGRAWLVGVSGVARVPVYRGWDLRRQGPFVRGELRGARRMGGWVPSAGLSVARQAPAVPDDALNTPDFADLAAVAGALVNISERASVAGMVRAPLWASEGSPRVFAGGATLRWVIGNPPEGHEH